MARLQLSQEELKVFESSAQNAESSYNNPKME